MKENKKVILLTKEEKYQRYRNFVLLLSLFTSIGVLFVQIVDARLSENTKGILNIIFVVLFLLMAIEQITRIVIRVREHKLLDYFRHDQVEIIYIILSIIVVPISLFIPSLLVLRWVCIFKIPHVIRPYDDEKVFQIIAKVIAIVLILFFIIPFLNVLANAISKPGQVINIFPKNIDWFALKYVIKDRAFIRSFANSIFITLTGTLISVVSMAMAAYPLSKPDMPLRKTMMIFFMIVMLFSGGMAPNILLINSLGLMDTIWALILPSVVMVYYLLLLKGFYESIPAELEESAKLDGASNFDILFKIIIPIASPMIATVTFFTAISYWNNINSSIFYITSNKILYPVPMYVKNFLSQNPMEIAMNNPTLLTYWDSIEMSYILMSIVPIAIAYPFIFKYLKNDISAGAVKG